MKDLIYLTIEDFKRMNKKQQYVIVIGFVIFLSLLAIAGYASVKLNAYVSGTIILIAFLFILAVIGYVFDKLANNNN
ncbi:MAG: hypothetical protein IAC58_07120 [Firmicutes bacterium]|uniref:Uncharacterized protein n=1 Tax=Candidatus Onthovivens merdipullorum TaxID=2840889 RepID=A0A9D9DKB1_9BACL|nr:hypothetical protein [Candidatus Onthovivens merdipullorum]